MMTTAARSDNAGASLVVVVSIVFLIRNPQTISVIIEELVP